MPPSDAAGIAHRVLAVVAGPVRHRRPVDHDGTDEVRFERADEHGGPAALAVADHDRLAGLRMALADDAEELGLGARDVREGLPGHRLGEEDHEIDRMPRLERHADLRVLLEPADAGPVAGPRIDDDEGPAVRVGLDAIGRDDAHEGVVGGPLEGAGIRDHLPFEVQQRRLAGLLVLEPVVAALAQGVPEQDGALREVEPVGAGVAPEVQRRRRSGSDCSTQRLARGLHRVEVTLQRVCAPLLIDLGDLRLHVGSSVSRACKPSCFGIGLGFDPLHDCLPPEVELRYRLASPHLRKKPTSPGRPPGHSMIIALTA